jgi:hypothetical protein
MADEIDSPVDVTSAESAAPGNIYSLEVGRDASLLQGPGESPDVSGDGRGVTSAMALSLGEDIAELGAEPMLEFEPTLVPRVCLTLGVREGCAVFDGRCWNSADTREADTLLSVADVTEYPGTMSVCRRSPALIGVKLVSGEFGRRELGDVSMAEKFVDGSEVNEFGGEGEGAIVVDLKMTDDCGGKTGR